MLKIKIRVVFSVALIVLLLSASIGGTLAYLADTSGPVENVFSPPTVDVTVTDNVVNNTKKDVTITNGSSFPVYIRVAIVANWRDADGKIVKVWETGEGTFNSLAPSPWVLFNGIYYYTEPVAANSAIPADKTLFQSFTYEDSIKPEGAAYLEMDLLVQAVQSSPVNAVQDVWGVTITKDSVTPYSSTTN